MAQDANEAAIERLLEAADIWFDQKLHRDLQTLIEAYRATKRQMELAQAALNEHAPKAGAGG